MDAVDDFRGTDRFQILGRIGAGGMGVVYEARDAESGRKVALKTLSRLDGQALLRFKNEFRALADLNHPNLVSLGELVEAGGEWFFTMELVDGVDFMHYVCGRPGSDADIDATAAGSFAEIAVHPRSTRRRPADDRLATGVMARGSLHELGPTSTVPLRAHHALDEARLRTSLVQLARGLCVLHDAGKVHRDIKPANILVTPEGQLVLLDFGLVSDREIDDRLPEGHIIGTAAYMAPEQVASARVGPAADWYAVGVLLYEALVGHLPYTGPWLKVLVDKQMAPPPPPRVHAPEAPADLDALCMALLAIDPAARPTGREVLARLGAGERPDGSSPAVASPLPPFVGRHEELAGLASAFEDTRRGGAVVVLIEGESGIGKTAVVRRFLDELSSTEPGAVVLTGRCYERESVPYKGVDGVIDSLSRFLLRLDRADFAAQVPPQLRLMAQVFPVLREVDGAAETAPGEPEVDPQELRRRLFSAVREALCRLAASAPLVVAIDDIQWADHDSRALLTEVLRPPGAPALLLVATVRPEGADQAAAIDPGRVRRLQLAPLDEAEARSLAAQLLARWPGAPAAAPAATAADIAREAGGHPFFIDELVRFTRAGGGDTSRPRLDEALAARLAALPDDARSLVEIAALAGGPLQQAAAARAAGLEPPAFAGALALLRAERLIRTSGSRGDDTLEPYHDQIRSAATARLDADHHRHHHRRLADALEHGEPAADPERLAGHWLGAGEHERAAHWTRRAAHAADLALAFDRAARLYRAALDILPADHPERRALTVRLGHALVNAGRGKQAAEAYLAAAAAAPPTEMLELRSKAAEQLLKSGHVEQGVATLRDVLAQIGIPYPTTPRRALLAFLGTRVRLRLRGTGFRPREARDLPPDALTRIDACWGAAGGFAVVDPVLGAALQGRHLQLALAAGEPYRVARALALEAGYLYALAPSRRDHARGLLDEAMALATRVGHPHALAMATGAAGIAAQHSGKFRESMELIDRASTLLRDSCPGTPWERAMCEVFAAIDLYYLGDLRGLAARCARAVVEAGERGDLFQADTVRVQGLSIAELAADQPAEVDAALAATIRRWPGGGYIRDCAGPLQQSRVRLYVEDGPGARAASLDQWRRAEAAGMLHNQHQRIEAWHVRGAAALAAAVTARAPRPFVAEAAAAAGKIERERMPWARPLAGLLRAGIAARRGDVDAAVTRLAEVETELAGHEMELYAAAARRRRGQLLGGDAGRALAAAAEAWMTAQGIKCPARMTAMLAPGF